MIISQQPFQLPPPSPITYASASMFFEKTAYFIFTTGIILAVITLVFSGIMYFWAGSDTDAKKAKGWFRNGIIGTFVILAFGVIIQTIAIIVGGGFFNTP